MIRSLSTLFMILILVTSIYAQTAPEAPAAYRPELTRGTSYTGFQWTPGVSDFNGKLAAVVSTFNTAGDPALMSLYGVHYGYFISTGWAIEGVVDFGTTSYESDVTNGTQKNDASQFAISAFAKYFFVPKFEDVSVWLGAGLAFGSVSTTVETPTAAGTNKTETSGSTFGFAVDFGAQYFLGAGFSLTANYQFGFASLSKPEYTVTSGSTSTTTKGAGGTIIGTRTGSLGLNFYF